jgi:hypothetical protein
VLVPTVLSRRTIAQMRGARVAAAFLSATSLMSCAILLLRPPHATYYHPHFTYDLGFWMTLVVSVVAVVLSLRLGGRDPRTEASPHDVARGQMGDETLH